MDSIFNKAKKNNSSFEISEDDLKKIEMPDMAKEPMDVSDENPSGYEDERWTKKSNYIKSRDNYTCQLCHVFNPMQIPPVVIKQGEYDTIHNYEMHKYEDRYYIFVPNYKISITFTFYCSFHLVMPRLNVHHKIYYRNRNLWDYPDDCLVTLCENCHHYIHSLDSVTIPIIEEKANGQDVIIGKTPTRPYLNNLDHTDLGTFQPFAIVKENKWGEGLKGKDITDFYRVKSQNKKWYDYQITLDHTIMGINYTTCYNTSINNHEKEEIKKVAEFIIKDFIENILGYREFGR